MARGGGVSNRPKIHFRCSFFLLFFFLEEGLFFLLDGARVGESFLLVVPDHVGVAIVEMMALARFFFHFCLVFGSSINQLMTRL